MEFKHVMKNFTLLARLAGNKKTGKGLMLSVVDNGGYDEKTVRTIGQKACGDCKHATAAKRMAEQQLLTGKLKPYVTGSCYVYKQIMGNGGTIRGLSNTFHRAEEKSLVRFAHLVAVLSEVSGFIRVGEFGDAAADSETASAIADIIKSIDSEVVRAGYTHQWRKKKAAPLIGLVMASVDTEEEEKKAQSLGWQTFRVMEKKEAIPAAIHCPNQKVKNSITCKDCGRCNGKTESIQINLH
jgi:hypothetical protein